MRAIARDYSVLNDKLWERFNRGKESRAWYYSIGVASLLKLGEYEDTKALYWEFVKLVDNVFGNLDIA